MRINADNYFDYAEAVHCFATLSHEGQWSELYSILSRSEFKPGPFWSEHDVVNDNPVYGEIDSDNVAILFSELQEYLEGREL